MLLTFSVSAWGQAKWYVKGLNEKDRSRQVEVLKAICRTDLKGVKNSLKRVR